MNVKAEGVKGALLSVLLITSIIAPLLLISAKAAWGQDIGWIRQFGSSDNDYGWNVAVDASGNVYVAGMTDGVLTGQSSSGWFDAFVRKYDASGNELWTRQFGTSDGDDAESVAVDGSDNVYVAGTTDGTLLGQTSSGGYDAFLVKLVEAPPGEGTATPSGERNWPLIAGIVAIIVVIGVGAAFYIRRR